MTRLFETWPIAILATLGADGRPHQVPVVFVHHAAHFWSPVDGKPKAGSPADGKPKAGPELARLRNVARDPRVGLLLEQYDDDWRRLWWLRVDGDAAVVRAPDDASFDAVAAALRRKYPQYEQTPLFSGDPTLLRVDPVGHRSWCAGPEAFA